MKPKLLISMLSRVLAMSVLIIALWGFWSMMMMARLQNTSDQPVAAAIGYPGPITLAAPTEGMALPELDPALTPTLLPDPGIRLGTTKRLSDQFASLSFVQAEAPRFVYPSTDGQVLAGVLTSGQRSPFGSVVLINLASGSLQKLADVSSTDSVQISSDYVVWTNSGQLFFFDRHDNNAKQLAIGDRARDPRLSGSIVVWENITKGQTLGLWVDDLATGEAFPVVTSTASAKAYKPLVSGNWIAYQSWDTVDAGATVGLDVIDMTTGENIELGRLANSQGYVPPRYAVDAPWVVWTELTDKPNLHLYNLDTRKSFVETVPSCVLGDLQGNPSELLISDAVVIFQGCFQEMGYDIRGARFFSIPISRGESQPTTFVGWSMAKGQLVWSLLVGPHGRGKTIINSAPIVGNK